MLCYIGEIRADLPRQDIHDEIPASACWSQILFLESRATKALLELLTK